MATEKKAKTPEEYITLLDITPGKGKVLSDDQARSLCDELKGVDLSEVKRVVTDIFHSESEQNKKWAQRINGSNPINLEERAKMIQRTNEIADKIIRVYDCLDQVSKALKSTTERNSPTKELQEKPKKRFSGTGTSLFKKSGTN